MGASSGRRPGVPESNSALRLKGWRRTCITRSSVLASSRVSIENPNGVGGFKLQTRSRSRRIRGRSAGLVRRPPDSSQISLCFGAIPVISQSLSGRWWVRPPPCRALAGPRWPCSQVRRLLCSEASVDSYRLRTGLLKDAEWPRIAQAMGALSEAQIYIDDSPNVSVMEMRTKARRLKSANNLGLIIVDYLQLMQGRNQENRVQEVSDISRGLKSLARELQIPVIACSQLSREPEKRPDHRPQLSDLRESGTLEQDSDLVLFIFRERFYNDNIAEDRRNVAEIIIAKHRNGPTGKLELLFIDEQTKFANLDRRRGS